MNNLKNPFDNLMYDLAKFRAQLAESDRRQEADDRKTRRHFTLLFGGLWLCVYAVLLFLFTN